MKRVLSTLLAMAITVSLGTTAMAAAPADTADDGAVEIIMEAPDGTVTTTTVNLNDLVRVSYDENGNRIPEPRISLSSHSVSSGSTTYYYMANGSYFNIARNVKVTFKMSLDKRVSNVYMGYKQSGGSNVQTKDYSGASPSTTITIPSDGNYCFWVKNGSSDSFTVNSGSITY